MMDNTEFENTSAFRMIGPFISIFGVLIFVSVVTILHALQDDYNPQFINS